MLVFMVFIEGVLAGFVGGLLGLGGGLFLAPLLLYSPAVVGIGGLTVKEVTGLTIVQAFAGTLSGVVRHYTFGFVSWRLVGYMGFSISVAALAGALVSRSVTDEAILAVFAVMALIALLLAFIPGRREGQDDTSPGHFTFNVPLAMVLAAVVGFTGGLVGQGGAFLLIPIMLYVLRIPTRIAIGSSLGIILFSATAGLAGKLATSQVPLLLAVALVGGAIPGAQLGALVSRRMRPRVLRYLLVAIIIAASARIWVDVLD